MINGFNIFTTNRAKSRVDVNAFPFQIHPGRKFIQNQSPKENVNFDGNTTVPTSSIRIHDQGVSVNQGANRSNRKTNRGVKRPLLGILLIRKDNVPNRRKQSIKLRGLFSSSRETSKNRRPDDESVSSNDEGSTKIKAFMEIIEDEPSVGKAGARSGQWVDITMKNVHRLLSMIDDIERKHVLDYTHVDLHYVEDQRKNLANKFNLLKQEISLRKLELSNRKNTVSINCSLQNKVIRVNLENESLKDDIIDLKSKADESSHMLAPEITSDSNSECDSQEPLPPLSKLIGAAPFSTSENLISLSDLTLKMADLTLETLVPKKTRPSVKIGRSPDISYIHVFECHVHIHNQMDHLERFDEKVDDGFFLGYSSVAKAFWVFNIRRQEIKETIHVSFSEYDEVISQSSTEGDAINFNESRSFPDDEFFEPRSKVTRCPGNTEYFPHVYAYENTTPFESPIPQVSAIPKDPSDDDQPSPTIPPSVEVILQTLVPQDIWSREKHIKLVNIIGEPLAIITTRSRIRDSDATSPSECLYVNFLSEMEPKKLIEALKEEGQEAIKIFLAYVAYMGFMVYQIDVKSAFLNKKNSEEVYVQQPPGFESSEYSNHVWSLMYLTASRPDIKFSTCIYARYQANPKESYLVAVKRIFSYLNGTPNLGLWYRKILGFNLKAYSDSDYAGCNLDRKSTSGGYQILEGKLVCWGARKQSFIAMSSTEAEYVAAAGCCAQDKPLSFTQNEFISTIGLPICKDVLPPKETVRVGLATLGLFDKDKPTLSSTVFVNSSPLKMKYFSPIWKLFMQYIVKCLGGMQGSHDQINLNQQKIAYCLIWGLETDIEGIIFLNLVHKLQNGKKNRELNIYYTRFLSLIFKKLLGRNYVSNDLTLVKPHTITAAFFQKLLASEVPLTSHMLKVAKLSEEPEQSLIPPSGEVNANDTVDKSLSSASVQPITQFKAPTDLKTTKKRIQPSSKPKSPNKVRVILPKKQVAKTQHAEVTVATADATKSLIASELAEEQGNQSLATKAKKVLDQNVKKIKDTGFVAMGESVKSFLTSHFSKLQDVSDSDLQSMPDDDLRSVSGFEDVDSGDTHKNEVSKSDHIFQDDIAFAERLSLQDHMDHIYALKDTLPQLIKDSIKIFVSESIAEELPHVEAQPEICLTSEGAEQIPSNQHKEIHQTGGREVGENNPETAKDTDVQGEQSVAKENTESAMATHKSKERKSERVPSGEYDSDDDELDKHPLSKRFKIMTPIPDIPYLIPLNTFFPAHLLKPEEQQKSVKEFTNQLFATTSSKFSPTPPSESLLLELNLNGKEAKKVNMMEEYNHLISFRADPMPITKISYVVNTNKEATMKITRGDNPLNLIVHPNFRLRTLVDRMQSNSIPTPGFVLIKGLVINEPESGIFFMNRNIDIAFQRENSKVMKEPLSGALKVKLTILNPNEFDLWKMRIKQYFLMTEYSIWEVIMNGDSPTLTKIFDGVVQVIAPATAEQMLAKKNELKARETLLMALPDKHQLKFNIYKDVTTLMKAIEKRNKADLEEQSLDDLFNNLKIHEAEVKGSSSSSQNTQNIAFVSLNNTDSTNESVNVVLSVSAASSKATVSTLLNVDSLNDDVIYSFFTSQSNSPQLDNEYLKQINPDDLEEIDLKWQMAMLTMKARRFLKRTERNLSANGTNTIRFDMSKIKCYNCHRRDYFARKCRSPRDNRNKEAHRRTVLVEVSTSNALVSQCDVVAGYDWSFQADEEPTNYALMAYSSSGSSSSSGSDNEVAPCSKACSKAYAILQIHYDNLTVEFKKSQFDVLSYKTVLESVEASLVVYQKNENVFEDDIKLLKLDVMLRDNALVELRKKFEKAKKKEIKLHSHESDNSVPKSLENDRYKSGEGYHDVPPPYTGTFMPHKPDLVFNDAPNASESVAHVVNVESTSNKPRKDMSKTLRPDAPIIEDWTSDSGDETEIESMPKQKEPSFVQTSEHVKTPRESVKKDEHPKQTENLRTNHQKSRGHKNSWNMKACFVCKRLNYWIKIMITMRNKWYKSMYGTMQLGLPRENNMYNVDLKNVVPSGDLTCLFAKATLDESNLWHRRLGHINFKTMNKLVKGNLIRGIPSKIFENNHICVACKKGKQHRASCKSKPIKSVSHLLQRTPQQKGVAKRKNRTLIEAARTMLADSLLPIPFWTEVVNTACYVQNRVLVTKPHSKTPYELLLGRSPSISFMRPFGCPVTILNTLDPLGKFDGKVDEGFLVGCSVNSKTFMVFKSRTKIIQETLHINFLENKPNVTGIGPTWLFDIDTLTKSMNYQPISTGSQDPQNTNNNAAFDVKENENEVHVSPSGSDKIKKHDDKAKGDDKGKSPIGSPTRVRDLIDEFEEFSSNNTNRVNAVSAPVTAAGKSSFEDPFKYPDDSDMLELKDIIYSDDEEDVGAEADLSNLETNIYVSSIPTTRVHKDHHVTQIIGDLTSTPQTRSMTRMEECINYDEVFAPVARIKAIRLFLAYASSMGFMVYQMDVKSDFLYGTIKEETVIATSLTEAEYVVVASCCAQEPSRLVFEEPTRSVLEEPSRSVPKEATRSFPEEPSRSIHEEPSRSVPKGPSRSVNTC
nr:uncharacterized mitochondrial protein AtMg00810-like [Tanacetum cinerariifolium]